MTFYLQNIRTSTQLDRQNDRQRKVHSVQFLCTRGSMVFAHNGVQGILCREHCIVQVLCSMFVPLSDQAEIFQKLIYTEQQFYFPHNIVNRHTIVERSDVTFQQCMCRFDVVLASEKYIQHFSLNQQFFYTENTYI